MPQKRIPDLDTALLTPQSNNPEGVTSHIIYVDSSRTDNYKNPNGSAERPFKTIPEAFASVPIQESEIDLTKTYLIYLLPGIYPEPINITSPVTIKGVDFLTCIITGKITVVQQLFMIQQVYIQEIECTEVRLNLIANCQINNAICTNSILRFITCTITNFEVYNSRIYLDLNAIVTSEFYIESDTELPYPIESSTVTEIIMGYSRWENPTFEFEMLNEGTIDIKFTNSYCESALVLQNGLFVHNFASVLTNATGDGFYESKAGYPVSGQSMTITLTPAEGQWKIDDGEWNISGATVSGLNFDQAYNVSFDTVEHYNTPDAVEITLLQGENDVRVIDYAPKDGTVTLTLDPNTARWKVDDGDWNVSGATLTDVTTMVEHTTTFEDVDHYITPEPMTGSLTPEQDLIADIEYTPINGTITVNITPAGAVTAGAQWSIDAGETWNDSGDTLTDIVPDDYSVTYKAATNYITPEATAITVTPEEDEVVNTEYLIDYGTITVNITPAGAVTAGAQWSIDAGETWNDSEATLTDIVPDDYSVTYKETAGYVTPEADDITVEPGEDEVVNTEYIEVGTITVNITPAGAVTAGAQWSIDAGETWNDSGDTLTDIVPDDYSVTYKAATNYITPEATAITVTPEEDEVVNTEYLIDYGTITVNITPAGAVTAGAQWSIDAGETWNDSEATLTDIVPDDYSVTYKETAGYVTPEADDITVEPGEAEVVNKTYIEE